MQGIFILIALVFSFSFISNTYFNQYETRETVTDHNYAPDAFLLQHQTFVRWADKYMQENPKFEGTAHWNDIVSSLHMPSGHGFTDMPDNWRLVADSDGYVICAEVRNTNVPATLQKRFESTPVTTVKLPNDVYVVGKRTDPLTKFEKDAQKCE